MDTWFWIAVIFTSPFWMSLGVVMIGVMGSCIETFLNLFKRK